MAQGAFETDFWKDANLRKVWEDIVPGEPLYAPLVYPVVDHTPRWEDRQLGLFRKITPD